MRTIVVSPVPGDPVASGNALASVFPIAGASLSNPYLVHIEPGEYDTAGQIILQDGVDIEGSGEDVTSIQTSVLSVVLANAELRELSLTDSYVLCQDKPTRLTNVTIDGTLELDRRKATLTNVTINSNSPDYVRAALRITGDATIDGLTINASLTGSDSVAMAIGNPDPATVTLRNATINAMAIGGAVGVCAVLVVDSDVTIEGVDITANGAPNPNGILFNGIEGINNTNTAHTLTISSSTVTAGAALGFGSDGHATAVNVADTQIAGTIGDVSPTSGFFAGDAFVPALTTWRCVDDYDGSFTPIATTCK